MLGVCSTLFGVEILPCIVTAYKGNTHLEFDLLAFLCLERPPVTDVVASYFATIFVIDLISSVICTPHGFRTFHFRLPLPESAACRFLVYANCEIHRKHSLRVVAEGSGKSHSFDFRVAYLADPCSGFVCKSLSEVHEDVSRAFRESVSLDAGAACGADLRLEVVCCQEAAVVTRLSLFVCVFRSIDPVVYIEFSCCRHSECESHFRASHAAEIHMRESCHETVVAAVRS